VLESVHARGPLDTATGSNIVVWIVIRHHYEPRFKAEEAVFLRYHHEEFHVTPWLRGLPPQRAAQGIGG
jgi:hypothetical protein